MESPAKHITTFSFKMLSGGVILIRACVNDYADSLNFILDTGSGGISLDSTTVLVMKIPVLPSEKKIRGIGGVRNVSFLYGATLHLPGIDVKALDFHVNDYELLSYSYGIHIDGIIGYSFLSRYIVQLNYDKQVMDIYSIGDFTYPKTGHILHPILTTLPIQTISFKDSRKFVHQFYFDTGAGLNFLLSEEYVADSAVLRKKRKKPVLTQAEGMGGRMTMRLTTVKEINIGPYRFKKVPTLLFHDESNITSYPFLGGLIGNDLLRRFNVILNYNKLEIHLLPNTHYNDLFDYTYSGLSIYYIDGQVEVDDVAMGSPAEKAGFQKGDFIVSVNGDFSKNIQSYKNIIQTSNEKIGFIVMRKGEPVILNMKTIRIL